jgi:serine/threonine-protein kinase
MRLSDDIEEHDLSGLPRPGETFDGKYRIEKVLGVGGMGAVLSAIHLRLEERVALKLLLPQWAQDQELVRRFVREGQASIKIRSEHVVRVLDVGLVKEQPYLVLEYLDGSDFAVLIHECGPLAIADAVDCLLQACEALAEAHTSGIIHRDLKPANLFLTHRADGSPCV